MNRRTFILALCVFFCAGLRAEKIAIVSVNDMHGNIDNMPRLAFVVDSIRSIYRHTLVLSAGDNRTGNPWNDQYAESSFPMTAMMNQIGFNASAVGNHEFDAGQDAFRRQAARAAFPYLSANLVLHDTLGLPIDAYKIFNFNGIKVGLLGAVKINEGRLDASPAVIRGIVFDEADEAIRHYAPRLRRECDVLVLLSHLGHSDDIEVASRFNYFDIIVGGHSHTMIQGNEMVNGVAITQCGYKLSAATVSIITLENGKVKNIESETISLKKGTREPLVENMIAYFKSTNEQMHRVLARAEKAFTSVEDLGVMMTEALRAATGTDIAIQNGGGIRISSIAQGDITVADVYSLDPFGNEVMIVELTGAEIKRLLLDLYRSDYQSAAAVSGCSYALKVDVDADFKATSIAVTMPDGSRVSDRRRYRVTVNSYVASTNELLKTKEVQHTGLITSDVIMSFLEKQQSVDYSHRTSYTLVK